LNRTELAHGAIADGRADRIAISERHRSKTRFFSFLTMFPNRTLTRNLRICEKFCVTNITSGFKLNRTELAHGAIADGRADRIAISERHRSKTVEASRTRFFSFLTMFPNRTLTRNLRICEKFCVTNITWVKLNRTELAHGAIADGRADRIAISERHRSKTVE
jgi:hypothetical protein